MNVSREAAGARGHGKRGARAYNGGLNAQPQHGPGAEPLVGRSGGEPPPPEAESFKAFVHLKPKTLLSIRQDRGIGNRHQ